MSATEALLDRDHPLNIDAWRSACGVAFEAEAIRTRFREASGHDLDAAPPFPIDQLVDWVTGYQAEMLKKFVRWFNSEIWGEDMAPTEAPASEGAPMDERQST